jgi:hypothetical protein
MLENLTLSVLYKYLQIYKLIKGVPMWECFYNEELLMCVCIWIEIALT